MNWGNKIILGLGTFMLFIVGACIYMITKDSDSLIDENYYESSLTYDKVYDSKKNLLDDHAKPILIVRNDTLSVEFMSLENKGSISFKRPSDGKMDKVMPFDTSSLELLFPIASWAKGNWTVEISWEHGGKSYFHNQALYLQ